MGPAPCAGAARSRSRHRTGTRRLSQLERRAASERANADELARAEADREIAFADLQIAREAATEADLEARQIEAKIEERTLRAPFSGGSHRSGVNYRIDLPAR